eukprot:g12497.t1
MKVFAFSICVLATVASAASRSSSSVAEMTKTKEKVRAQRPTMEQRPDLARNKQGDREIMTKVSSLVVESGHLDLHEHATSKQEPEGEHALVVSYEYCAGLGLTYFGVQNSVAAECSNHVRAFTHQCFDGDENQKGKRPDAQCSRPLHGLPSNVNNGNGGGGGIWRNSIYMIAAPVSCPSGYTKIDPIKPDLYGDVPEKNASPTKDADAVAADWAEDNQSTSEYEAESLGYSPYEKIDADSVDKCGEKCSEDSNCVAMASDGMSACFFYDADNPPTPYRTPGSFITCKANPNDYFDTGYEFDMTTASGTTLRVKHLGCYCDHPT